MESDSLPSSPNRPKCCNCGCICAIMNRSLSGSYLRSVKRKYEELDEDKLLEIGHARVEIGNECQALREMVTSQQQTIQELISELEEERNASSSAASEAMSMILRLQREKAEIQMESRQFKRFAEEKMSHDQQENSSMEDLLFKREQTIQSLTYEVEAYKHRMMSYGLTEAEAVGGLDRERTHGCSENLESPLISFPHYEIYPPLKVNINESQAYMNGDDEADDDDVEKYMSCETPSSCRQLKDRINQLEKNSPRTIRSDRELRNVLEKVDVGHSSRRANGHLRKFSMDNSPRFGASFRKAELSHLDSSCNLIKKGDSGSEDGDEMNDRVYTIDSINQGSPMNGVGDEYGVARRDSDLEIQKLFARLHALEADRESMRQAIISIGTDKAQLVLLREIAQNLCKEVPAARAVPTRGQAVVRGRSFLSIFKCIASFIFWRRKARRCRYMFGLSTNNTGLLLLLDRGPHGRQWRGVTGTRI